MRDVTTYFPTTDSADDGQVNTWGALPGVNFPGNPTVPRLQQWVPPSGYNNTPAPAPPTPTVPTSELPDDAPAIAKLGEQLSQQQATRQESKPSMFYGDDDDKPAPTAAAAYWNQPAASMPIPSLSGSSGVTPNGGAEAAKARAAAFTNQLTASLMKRAQQLKNTPIPHHPISGSLTENLLNPEDGGLNAPLLGRIQQRPRPLPSAMFPALPANPGLPQNPTLPRMIPMQPSEPLPPPMRRRR